MECSHQSKHGKRNRYNKPYGLPCTLWHEFNQYIEKVYAIQEVELKLVRGRTNKYGC